MRLVVHWEARRITWIGASTSYRAGPRLIPLGQVPHVVVVAHRNLFNPLKPLEMKFVIKSVDFFNFVPG